MKEFGSYTSLFEIFAIVYIGATSIEQMLKDLLQPMISYYKKDKEFLVENVDRFIISYSIQDLPDTRFHNLINAVFHGLIAKVFNQFSKWIIGIKNGLNKQTDIWQSNYIDEETSRLILKYKPLFFYTSLYCFVCLILSGSSGIFYELFYYRFLIFSYFFLFDHLLHTRKKDIDALNEISVCKDWLFNVIYIFSFTVLSHLVLSLLTITNIIDLYYTFTKEVFHVPEILFVFIIFIIIGSTLTSFYYLYKNYHKRLNTVGIALITIEGIVRFSSISNYIGINFHIHPLHEHTAFFMFLGVFFIFIPVFCLLAENFLPSIKTKFKLRIIKDTITYINQRNVEELNDIINETNNVNGLPRLKILSLFRPVLIIFTLTGFAIGFVYFYLSKADNPIFIKYKLRNIVKNAVQSEFALYNSVSATVDSGSISKHYQYNSSAYINIVVYALEQRLKGNILCERASNYSLNDISVIYRNGQYRAETNETWNLEWYNPNLNQDAKVISTLNHSGKHIYYFKLVNNTWKISYNFNDALKVDKFGFTECNP